MSNEDVTEAPRPLVLFVDDMPDIRELVEVGMHHYAPPFAVAFADSVEAALRVVRESRPAAVVLDVNLGGETGMDVAEFLHEYEPHIPKAVLTAYDLSLTHAGAEELGMEVWSKPITMRELITNVLGLLEEARARSTGNSSMTLHRVVRAAAAAIGLLSGAHVNRLH